MNDADRDALAEALVRAVVREHIAKPLAEAIVTTLRTQPAKSDTTELQELCRLAARHVPIKYSWSPGMEPKPWGCILDKAGTHRNPGYCDECPARNLCPYEHKEWSK